MAGKSYRVLQELDDRFMVHDGEGKPFPVAKKGLGKATLARIQAFARGGEVKGLADGGEVHGGDQAPDWASTQEADPSIWDRAKQIASDVGQGALDVGKQLGTSYLGSMVAGPAVAPFLQAKEGVDAIKQVVPAGTGDGITGGVRGILHAAYPGSVSAAPAEGAAPEKKEAARTAPAPAAPQPGRPAGPPRAAPPSQGDRYNRDLDAAGEAEKAGNVASAQAAAVKAQQEGDVLHARNEQLASVATQRAQMDAAYAQHYQKEEDQYRDLTSKYAQAEIDPTHLWASRSTGEKVLAGIGLVLGGIGAGATGGVNRSVEIINNAIKTDMEAQQANLDKMGKTVGMKGNLLGMMRQKFGDDAMALNATEASMLLRAKGQLEEVAAKNVAPERQAALGAINAQVTQRLTELKEAADVKRRANASEATLRAAQVHKLMSAGQGANPAEAGLQAVHDLRAKYKDGHFTSPLEYEDARRAAALQIATAQNGGRLPAPAKVDMVKDTLPSWYQLEGRAKAKFNNAKQTVVLGAKTPVAGGGGGDDGDDVGFQ